MESSFTLLVLLAVFTQLFGASQPGPVQSQDTDSQTEADSADKSGKCYKYEGLLNDMLPIDYLEDPVKNLRQTYVSMNIDLQPDEKYYLTVLKTYDAYLKGLIKGVKRRTLAIHKEGMRTEIYLTAPGYFENRLISHSDISRARSYFTKRQNEECGSSSKKMHEGHSAHETNMRKETRDKDMKCLKKDQIRDFDNQMKKIDVNLEPGVTYYKLVLRINRSVHCKQLIVIEGTLITGTLGIKTEEYFFEDDHTKLRLPSIRDRRQARTFFKERKQKSKPIHVLEPSFSSSDEGQSMDKKKQVAAAAGAVVVANRGEGSSSDESDKKHDLGGSKPIAKERKQKSKPMHVLEPSFSSSDEGQSMDKKKQVAAAAGAVVVANRGEGSSSDESDKKHDLGGSKPIAKERRQKSKPMHVLEPSISSSDEGQSRDKKKQVAAGAVVIANKARESSSDESDKKHDLRGSKLIAAPVVIPRTVESDRRPDVPLYPLKDQAGVPTASPSTTITSPVPTLAVNPPPQNTGKPALLRKQSSLVREEDIDVRVKVKTEISIKRQTDI